MPVQIAVGVRCCGDLRHETLITFRFVVGKEIDKMGKNLVAGDPDDAERERLVLHVDDRGRLTIPKAVRDRLGIESDTEITAYLTGSMLTVDPRPSSKLQPATAGRDDWTNTTPTDAGESLFGPTDTEDTE